MAEYAKPEGKRHTLPPRWREIVATVTARTWTAPVMARALGMSRRTFQRALKEHPDLAAHIAECDDHLVQRLVHPLVERALAGDHNLSTWLLERLDPARFGARPTTAVQVNNYQPPPKPTRDELLTLLRGPQSPAIEHQAPEPTRDELPADAQAVHAKVTR